LLAFAWLLHTQFASMLPTLPLGIIVRRKVLLLLFEEWRTRPALYSRQFIS